MTTPTDRIAEVLREHYEYAEFDDPNSGPACSCGWEWDGTPFSMHVADQLTEALELTEEISVSPSYSPEARIRPGKNLTAYRSWIWWRRWISDWSAMEQQP